MVTPTSSNRFPDGERFAAVLDKYRRPGARGPSRGQLEAAYLVCVEGLSTGGVEARTGSSREAIRQRFAKLGVKLILPPGSHPRVPAAERMWPVTASYWRQVGYDEGRRS